MKTFLAAMKTFLAAIAVAVPAFAIASDGADKFRGGKPRGDRLKGDYVEARTCDVWVGSCFANSETSEAGKQATLAWKFSEGAWRGVDLTGLGVVLIVDAKSTLGDRFHSPLPVRNVLLIDERASAEQGQALRAFVAATAGELVGEVVEERLVAITLEPDCCKEKGCAKLAAGEIVRIETRCLHVNDKVCGHEETYYPPLTAMTDSHPVYTVEHVVGETLLQRQWTDRDSRSAFLGKFDLPAPRAPRAVEPEVVVTR